jgi:hypothetical protein
MYPYFPDTPRILAKTNSHHQAAQDGKKLNLQLHFISLRSQASQC